MEFGMRSDGVLDFHFYYINTIDTRLMQLGFFYYCTLSQCIQMKYLR